MYTNYYAVESEDEDPYDGLFLGKRAGGWVFQIKWHDWTDMYENTESPNHPYRNFDEFVEYVDGKVIKNEYGEVLTPEEFINMVEDWCEENPRTPNTTRDSVWKIDGYYFIRGDWS